MWEMEKHRCFAADNSLVNCIVTYFLIADVLRNVEGLVKSPANNLNPLTEKEENVIFLLKVIATVEKMGSVLCFFIACKTLGY